MGKAATKAQNKYIAKAYDRISLVVPKGRREDIARWAEALGMKSNGAIGELIRQAMGMTPEEWRRAPEHAEPGFSVDLPGGYVEYTPGGDEDEDPET